MLVKSDIMGFMKKKPELTIKIEGMTCGHCSIKVKKVIQDIKGVKRAEIDLEGKMATVTLDKEGAVSIDKIISEINKTGYMASRG